MKITKKRLRQIIKEEIEEGYEEVENYPGDTDDRTDEEVYAKMYDALRPGTDPDAPDYESEDYDEIEPLPPPHEEYKV